MGIIRIMHKILVRKPKEKRLFGRLRHRWEDNIKVDVDEMDGSMWIRYILLSIGTCGRPLNTAVNFQVP
jgi:hypothetical protein